MAKSGQTVVFSGLLQESKETIDKGIPILGDLPYLGPLFKYQKDTSDRKELMIVLTPYLVDSDEDIEMSNQDEVNRMHWCYCDVAEIYGDLSYGNQGYVTGSTEVIYPDSDPTGENPQFIEEGKTGGNPLQRVNHIPGEQPLAPGAGHLSNGPGFPTNAGMPTPRLNNAGRKSPKRDSSQPIGTYFGSPATKPSNHTK